MAKWSEKQLVEVIEKNRFEAFASLGRSSYGDVEEDAAMLRVYTNIIVVSPLCGWIFRARLTPIDLDRKIDQAVGHFASRKLPVLWNTGPSTQPPDLKTYLIRYGFTEVFELAGMATRLNALNESLPIPTHLEIKPIVNNDEALKQWVDTFTLSFNVGGNVEEDIYHLFASLLSDPGLPWHLFLTVLDGKPVATSAMYTAAGVAGIYFVGTIPEVRRRGIGSLSTLAPLKKAADMDYEIAVLHASPMAVNMYRSLGFKEYCRMGLFAWQPDE